MTSLHSCPSRSFARACDCRAERIIHKLTLGAERWAMVESWKAGNVERWKGRKVKMWKRGKIEELVGGNVEGLKVERRRK